MIDNYLTVLDESLSKKIALLEGIKNKSEEQSKLLDRSDMTMQALDKLMDEKAALIGEIDRLDEGFDSLYQKIKAELLQNKDLYKEQIRKIQDKIRQVIELSTSIQAIEARNKSKVETYFKKEKTEIKRQRLSSQVSMSYYQNMNHVNIVPPQFMDQKK